ncbi:cation acetate symporter, partial [Algoriphagus aestuarii]|nr:cation acetate symporter [Algoriphagus aestuarii]
KGKTAPGSEVRVARITSLVIGAVAIVGGIFAKEQNVAFLVALAFAVAASANLPTILYTLFWKRFNTQGALWSIYGGLITTITLIVFSPAVSGSEKAMFPDLDFAFFPLSNPGIISIQLSFFLGWLGTMLSSEHDAKKHAEMEVRSLTGAGAEKAVSH